MAGEARLEVIPATAPWRNWHHTVEQTFAGYFKPRYPLDNTRYASPAINACTTVLQQAIAQAKAQNRPIRAAGRGWSLSEAPACEGWLIDMTEMSGLKPLADNQIDPAYPGSAEDRQGLWMVQGGTYISRINRVIEADGFERSLKTSGAANGQTIAGATATGTHGSRLGFPALHDTLVAIHLLAGDKKQYWIERASYPVLKTSLPAKLGAEILRDDDVFNAVVLGMGAFGVVHNVVLETRPRLFLKARNFGGDSQQPPILFDQAMRQAIRTLDLQAHPLLRHPAGKKPYFFQPIIDPNSNPPEVLVSLMYEETWPGGYQPDYGLKEGKFGPGFDFITVLGSFLETFPGAVPLVSKIARAQLFESGNHEGSWGELFGYKTPRTKVASGSVAVPLERSLDALDELIKLNTDMGGVPLVYGCRYVAKSEALLAMNRFDTTFVISIDGIWNQPSRDFFDAIPGRMDAAGIPFTQHWGKTNAWTRPRVRSAYGVNYDKWIAARHRLLPDPADRELFTNAYMRQRGLDG